MGRHLLPSLSTPKLVPCLSDLDRAWAAEEAIALLKRKGLVDRRYLVEFAERCADAAALEYGAACGEARRDYLLAVIDDAGEGAKAAAYRRFLDAIGAPPPKAEDAPSPESADETEETWPEGPTDDELRALEAEEAA